LFALGCFREPRVALTKVYSVGRSEPPLRRGPASASRQIWFSFAVSARTRRGGISGTRCAASWCLEEVLVYLGHHVRALSDDADAVFNHQVRKHRTVD